MPLLYRKVVPNVPDWTAGNDCLVYGSGGLSYRAPVKANVTLSGTVTLGSALTSKGFPSTVAISDTAVSQAWDYGTPFPIGGADIDGKHVTGMFDVSFYPASAGISDAQLVYLPPGGWGNVSFWSTWLELPRTWRFGFLWDAAAAYAQWYAWPVDNFPEFEVADGATDFPWSDYGDMGIAIIQGVHTRGGGVYPYIVGGTPANEPPNDFRFEGENLWPIDALRLGGGDQLFENDTRDYWNIEAVDLRFDVSTVYADPDA